ESCLRAIDISGLNDDLRRQEEIEEAQAAARRLSAESGTMLQAVWFDAGRSSSGRLLLTIHHLAVDGVSWRILVPDFAAAYAAIAAGHPPVLEPCPVSFRGWAERLNREALNPERVKELSFWTDMLKDAQELVPNRQLVVGSDTV